MYRYPSLVRFSRIPRGSTVAGMGTDTAPGASRFDVRYLFDASRVVPCVMGEEGSDHGSSDVSCTFLSNIPYISRAASMASLKVGVSHPISVTPCRR